MPSVLYYEEQLKQANEEIARLNDWINDCQSGMYINCVYCGHRYGPDTEDHLNTMQEALHEHIRICPKHPLSKALKEILVLQEKINRLEFNQRMGD